ncbi:MAG: CopD family protein [Ilumatobacteraceae bacterium]|nr:CopD family protein [Ilumatobacteraceae bacterium]
MSKRAPVPHFARLLSRSIVAVIAAVIGLTMFAPGSALAENTVTSSSPANGSTIPASPDVIEIVFAEQLGDVNTIALECNTELFTLGRPKRSDDLLSLSAEVPDALPKGTCVARWGVSDAEGEPNGVGNVTFNIANDPSVVETTTTVEDSAATAPDASNEAPISSATSPDEVIDLSNVDSGQGPLWLGRLLSVLGVATLFGSLIVIAAAWPEGVEYLVAVRFIRGVWVLALVGTVLYVSAAAAAVTGKSLGAGFSPAAWFDLLDAGVPGIAALARLMFVAAAAWVAFRPDRVIDPATQMAALGVPALAVVTIGFSRTDSDLAAVGVALGVVHALAMAVWIGGVILLARVVLAGPGEEDLVHAVRGFGRLSSVAIITTILSGVAQMILLDGGDLFGSSHGRVVILKAVVVAVMVFVALSARQFVNERLARANEMTVPMASRLRRAFSVEAAAGFIVLAMSAWLLSLTPPNVDTGPAISYAIELQVEVDEVDLNVVVGITSNTVGTAGLSVDVEAPEFGIAGMEVVLEAPPNDTIGTITQPIPLTEPGLAVLLQENGVPLTVAGNWTLVVNVVIDGTAVTSDPLGFTIRNADGTTPTTELTIPPVVVNTIPATTLATD